MFKNTFLQNTSSGIFWKVINKSGFRKAFQKVFRKHNFKIKDKEIKLRAILAKALTYGEKLGDKIFSLRFGGGGGVKSSPLKTPRK